MNTNLRFIWADKIVLGFVLLAAIGAAVLWLVVVLAAGLMGANHVLASLGTSAATTGVLYVALLWAGLRMLDFVFHGATWRMFHAEPASPVAINGNLIAH